MRFPAKVKRCAESLQGGTRYRGQARLSTTSQSHSVRQGQVAAPSVCFATARIPLAAAPTAPPCFRHWRRSSPLHIISASGLTDSTRTASPTKRKAPGELQLLGGFSFGEANGTSHDSISSICDSLQKSSTTQKIYNCALRPTCYLAKFQNNDTATL